MNAAQFLQRIDARYAADLTAPEHGDPVSEARITIALGDAAADLEGYRPRIPSEYWPKPDTFDLHVVKVALYLLTLNRPGQDFAQIRRAYEDVIAFYTHLVDGAAQAGGGTPPVRATVHIPPEVFSDAALKGFP